MTTVFLAGATGAIGRVLSRMLVDSGHTVTGTSRSPERADALRRLGVAPAVVDVFDAASLAAAVAKARPEVVHQLTDLPPALDPARMPAALEANARLRVEGTRNLVAAATAAGARRLIAQSIGFAYAPGPTPYREDAPLNTGAPTPAGASARGVASLEQQVLQAPMAGVVLRYGRLYGPGTGFDAPPRGAPLHVEDAARAALLAVTAGAGIYNIAEDDGTLDCSKAQRELGWAPRMAATAPPKSNHRRSGRSEAESRNLEVWAVHPNHLVATGLDPVAHGAVPVRRG